LFKVRYPLLIALSLLWGSSFVDEKSLQQL
jgi:hypothetical protein